MQSIAFLLSLKTILVTTLSSIWRESCAAGCGCDAESLRVFDGCSQTDRQTDKQTLLPKLTAAARQRVSDPMDLDAVIALPEEEDIVLEGLISKKSRTRDSDGGWQVRRAMMMMIFIGTLFCNLHRDANGLYLRHPYHCTKANDAQP